MRDLFGPAYPVNKQLNSEGANAPQSKIRLDIVGQEQMGGGYVTDVYVALPSESLYRSELTDYRNSTWIKMIVGELPVDYWDTYIEEYNRIGGAILTQEANDWYESTQ
jgi:putative aldouronate transport system substrate-binding protein